MINTQYIEKQGISSQLLDIFPLGILYSHYSTTPLQLLQPTNKEILCNLMSQALSTWEAHTAWLVNQYPNSGIYFFCRTVRRPPGKGSHRRLCICSCKPDQQECNSQGPEELSYSQDSTNNSALVSNSFSPHN